MSPAVASFLWGVLGAAAFNIVVGIALLGFVSREIPGDEDGLE